MLKLNQKGFTAFEVVIVIVALAAVGAAGYFAYEARQDKTNYAVDIPKKKAPNTKSQEPKSNEVVVKELGVKLTLKEGEKVTYTYEKIDNPTDVDGNALAPLHSALFKINGCDAGAITKTTDEPKGRFMPSLESNAKKLGSFWIMPSYPSGGIEEGCIDYRPSFTAAYNTAALAN